ncbi:MAG: sarcosine oxidase subunit gamma [Rhodobacteraceae bacterium]|nr:sarcosine oxidase subunit gamma [Paracoccaceae bacterium]
MPEHRLKPLTPLGHAAPETVTIGPLTITEVVTTALASLASRRGRAADVAAVAAAQGIPLPGPGRVAAGPTYTAFWLGPDQWMVEAPFASHEDIAAILRPAFADAASITEQTDAWARFDLAAADLPALFERLCGFDLRASPTDAATRTVIEHLGCYLVRRTDTALTIYGPRSSAQSLHHTLTTAARSVY